MQPGFTILLAFAALPAWSADINVLSAGAVEPGLRAFREFVQRESGHDLKLQFATAPQIARRLDAGESFDLLVAPRATLDQAADTGRGNVDSRVPVGRVGAGIVVRGGGPVPNVATLDALKGALLAADTIVYNTASTGLYLDRLFAQMGILEALKPKTTRYADGASVMEHLLKGSGNQSGFGAITEIRMYEIKGLRLAGPLPADVQNYTDYEAVLMREAATPDAAQAVLKMLAAPAGRAALVAGGVE